MIADFYKTFKKENNTRKLPASVSKVLIETLPKGYKYEFDDTLNRFVVVPTNKNIQHNIEIKISSDCLEELPDWAKKDTDSILDYSYRMQKPISIDSIQVIDNNKSMELIDFFKDPFNDSDSQEMIAKRYIYPSEFPAPKEVAFGVENGQIIKVYMKRVPYDSKDYVKYKSEGMPSLDITWYISEHPGKGQQRPSSISIKVSTKKAISIKEVINSFRILKGFVSGNLRINNYKIGKVLSSANPQTNIEQIDQQLDYWGKLEKLEEILGVSFVPGTELSQKDIHLLSELSACFIDNKNLEYTEPFESFEVEEKAVNNPDFKDIVDNKKKVLFTFTQGPNIQNFMGTSFALYSTIFMLDIIVDKVEIKGDSAQVYVKKFSQNPWKLIKRYALSESDAEIIQNELFSNYRYE